MIRVLSGGQCTTIQDRGRFGYAAAGIPRSGAMAPFLHAMANLLVKNATDAACLEIYGTGPALQFTDVCEIAICGGHHETLCNGQRLPLNRPLRMEPGDVVQMGWPIAGMTSYLAVHGSIQAPLVLGSRSTDIGNGLGGIQGRTLRSGDILPTFTRRLMDRSASWARLWQNKYVRPISFAGAHNPIEIRFIPGRDAKLYPNGFDSFVHTTFSVNPNSNRVAMRFGEQLQVKEASMSLRLTEGTTYGTIQLLPAGHPLVLMADGPPSGGYPVLGEVIVSYRDVLASLLPRQRVQFIPTSLDEAARDLRKRVSEYRLRAHVIDYWWR